LKLDVQPPPQHRWRLIVPLSAIVSIVAIAGLLLYLSQVFERNRQEQQLIADALWADQSVDFELQRIVDGLFVQVRLRASGKGRPADAQSEMRDLLQRNPAIVAAYRWVSNDESLEIEQVSAQADLSTDTIRGAALRAYRLRRPATQESYDPLPNPGQLVVAVPDDTGTGGNVLVVVVSLERLLQNTIPWWLAHSARITLEDSKGTILAQRDPNVIGGNVYTRKIATPFIDRTLYLNVNSSQGTPFLIPNLLGLSAACLSLLLVWTVYALWRDLAKRTETEAALRAQQALQTAMENSLVTGLRARDLQGRVTYANPAFCDMVGYSLDELRRFTPPMKYWAPEVRESAEARFEMLATGSVQNNVYESKFIRPNGETVDVLMHETPLLDGSGVQIGWMASVQDISDQKRSTELLREQTDRIQKMSRLMTMGEMASALAHELNQPLSAATSYISAGINLIADPSEEAGLEDAVDYFGKAKLQTGRAGEIIRRVRQFVGNSAPVLAPVNIAEIVVGLLALIQLQSMEVDGRIKTVLGERLPPVMADRILLEQIILNLTKNAFEAVTHLELARREVVVTCQCGSSANEVVVIVTDCGVGLGEASDKILSSTFVTTKPGGLGMGLAVCRSALELLGSKLSYRGAPHGGAEFYFVLRAAPGS
jgi:two-component system, LuxR family, sensor histidine kinase DctS